MSNKTAEKLPPKGEAIRILREKSGITQLQLALASETSQRCISDAESENREIRSDTLRRIARRFSVSLSVIAHVKLAELELEQKISTAALEVLQFLLNKRGRTVTNVLNRSKLGEDASDQSQLLRFLQLNGEEREYVPLR